MQGKLNEMQATWGGFGEFRLHGMNRNFVKFLLSRITGFIEQQSGMATNFSTYFVSHPGTKAFEVEHIWSTSSTNTGTSSSNSMSSTPIATASVICCCCHTARSRAKHYMTH